MSDSKRVEFPCNVGAGREAARALKEFLAGKGFDEELLFACELSLTEACNNAVQHAVGAQRDQTISVEAACANSHIELTVTDRTSGFRYPGKLPPPDPEIKSGRGLFLIQSMMDDVSYERGNGKNVLRMTKRVSR